MTFPWTVSAALGLRELVAQWFWLGGKEGNVCLDDKCMEQESVSEVG